MHHRNYTTYLQRELDFLKLLISRFHEQEKVNELELDVALKKIQDVYELLLQIKLLPDRDDEKITAPPQPKPEPKSKPIAVEVEVSVPAEVSAPVKVSTPAEVSVTADVSVPKDIVVEQEKNVDAAKSTILAEKISPSDFHPINETLAQNKTGSDLSSKLQTVPLSSISSGIGLNDKFLYIRELFKGDNDSYANAIQHLDAADSLANALDFIHLHFDWDEKNETAQKFINLLYRRHGSD